MQPCYSILARTGSLVSSLFQYLNKERTFFFSIFPHSYHLQCPLFFPVDLNFHMKCVIFLQFQEHSLAFLTVGSSNDILSCLSFIWNYFTFIFVRYFHLISNFTLVGVFVVVVVVVLFCFVFILAFWWCLLALFVYDEKSATSGCF